MRVSIVINNHNYGAFVGACIESALTQTYGPIEIIVVDDGSTDHSCKVLETYRDRIKLIYKENGGQGSALNHGFHACTGDIIFFLDADDVLAPECVETVLPAFTDGICKVHFNLEVVDGQGQQLAPLFHKTPLVQGDLLQNTLNTGLVDSMPMSGNAFHRSFLEKVLPMDEGPWRRSADVYLFNLATLFGKIGAIDAPLGGYRVHGRNVSKNVEDGRLNHVRITQLVDRDVRMDQYLTRFADKLGYTYKRGILLTHSAHAQLRFIACASTRPVWKDFFQRRLTSFVSFVGTLFRSPLAMHKTAAIALMSFFYSGITTGSSPETLCA
jgi:glycosyltransferase involved in cell wall biosynthesis